MVITNGKYEEWRESSGKPAMKVSVNALLQQDGDGDSIFRGRDDDDAPNLENRLHFACLQRERRPCRHHPVELEHLPNVTTKNHFEEFTCRTSESDDLNQDDKAQMVQAPQRIAHKVTVGSKAPQQARKQADCPPIPDVVSPLKQRLTKQHIDRIVAAVNSGEMKLPDLDLPSDEDYVVAGSLADTGSAARAADQAKHFPGAEVRESAGQKQDITYVTAGKGELENLGESDVPRCANNNRQRVTTFQNAKVGLSSFSISHVADEMDRVVSEGDGSYVLHNPAGHQFDLIISGASTVSR